MSTTSRLDLWNDRYELVAEVTRAEHCANFIKVGQSFVFDLRGRVLPERSSAALCLGILARLEPALLIAQDRAQSGLHPVSPSLQTYDCFDTGLDHGGMGKVCVRFHLRERATCRVVEDAARDPASVAG
jgi:uncharacterized repeat protein (TIGR04076 family)